MTKGGGGSGEGGVIRAIELARGTKESRRKEEDSVTGRKTTSFGDSMPSFA